MHGRQRSPGNGYRSGSMGMGLGGSSFYASEYRRDNGFGRGHDNPKSFPPLPSRKGDIFIEAGRLAAEYLVSQGLLPPNALSIKSQNACFKKHSVEFQDGDCLEGRTSALARLGNPIPDRRKFGLDHFNQKLRKRGASFASNGSASDWGRDFKRTASWSDKLRASPDIKDNDDVITRHHEHRQQQQQVGSGVDNVSQKSNSNESAPKTEDVSDLDTETNKAPVSSEMDLPASSSVAAEHTYTEVVEFIKSSNDLGNTVANKELNDNTSDDKVEKPSISNNFSTSLSAWGSQTSSSVFTDLLTLCKSVKVPTRTRSSLTHKGLKADPLRNNGDESNSDMGCLQGPDILAGSESGKGFSSGVSLTEKAYDHLDSESNKVQYVHSAENVDELDAKSNPEKVASLTSQSCQDKADIHDNRESDARLAEYGSCGYKIEGRGEKRAADADDLKEDTKKLREWLPSIVPKTEDYFLHNNSVAKKESLREDEDSPDDKATLASDHGSLMSNRQITQGGNRLFLQYSEEKQSLPSSFRTCDLNLIEASEIHENDEDDPILMYPSVSESSKGATPIDIDLSISHTTVSGEFNNRMTSGKEIEVIDLENDSVQEGKSLNTVERKTEAVFPGLEGFPNHAQNTSDMHDVQDGYGLMISDLLGSDFPNCSSVSGDLNSVHNEMGLHNGTGTLGEDDSIYMSLGEIPLSYLRTWEQPPSQDYEKPF